MSRVICNHAEMHVACPDCPHSCDHDYDHCDTPCGGACITERGMIDVECVPVDTGAA